MLAWNACCGICFTGIVGAGFAGWRCGAPLADERAIIKVGQ